MAWLGGYLEVASKTVAVGVDELTPDLALRPRATPVVLPNHEEPAVNWIKRYIGRIYVAAGRGYVDDIIDPRDTRPFLIDALETLQTKRDKNPPKKHGNIPL